MPKKDNPLTGIEKDLKEMKEALAESEAKVEELTETAKRAMADLQNFRRRAEEERGNLILYANQQFLQSIFPVIDNFQRAFQHIPEDIAENEWVKGVYAIEKQFIETLNGLGLQEIAAEPGTTFDPTLHEAVMQDSGEKDSILECLEKGYTFNEHVVRPAKVKVGDGS